MAVKKDILGGRMFLRIEGFQGPGMDHVFSSKIGWDQEDVLGNVEAGLGLGKNKIYALSQVHGARIVRVDDQPREEVSRLEADGLVTNRRGQVLTTYHSDCAALYFFDHKKGVVGLCHSGWRGTYLDIAGRMVEVFQREYGSRPEDIKVGIGPYISGEKYQVGEEVYEKFHKKYGPLEAFERREDGLYLDIGVVIRHSLVEQGIREEEIYSADLCTYSNPQLFYSYRYRNISKEKGTMLASIVLS